MISLLLVAGTRAAIACRSGADKDNYVDFYDMCVADVHGGGTSWSSGCRGMEGGGARRFARAGTNLTNHS